MRHGVIFTDTSMPHRDFGPDRPRAIFADRQEFSSDIAAWVQSRFHTTEPDEHQDMQGGLGADGVHALVKLLAEPFHLRVPLVRFMDDDDREIELLTQRQFVILSAIQLLNRVAICGGAGTGKTVLAVETANRAAEHGQHTLLTCYNRALAGRLASQVRNGCEVRSFHSLCGRAAQQAGISAPIGVPEQTLHEHILPELLFDASGRLPEFRYDTIVVDEGQDFRAHWWPALEAVLRPGGRLVIFHDFKSAPVRGCRRSSKGPRRPTDSTESESSQYRCDTRSDDVSLFGRSHTAKRDSRSARRRAYGGRCG